MRRWIVIAVFGLLALAALFAWRHALPDLEIRYAPHQTTAGRIFPGHALGEGFRCEFDGLHAIDVALVPLGGIEPTALELALHVRDPNGPVLRRATLAPSALPRGDAWARFEFAPIDDSSGVTFWFELTSASPSSHGPWTRYRGVPYLVREWGSRVLDGRVQEGDLLPSPPREGLPDVLFSRLSALAFAVDGLDAAAGPASLTLSDPKTGAVLRKGELAPRAPIANGWAFFAFEPLVDSRWRAFHYRLDLPPGARLVGSDGGPSLIAFHDGGTFDTGALGATCGTERTPDRDLVFRAWSRGGAGELATRLVERSSWKLAVAALAWLAAIGVLVSLSFARGASRP